MKKIQRYNKLASKKENKPDEIIELLRIKKADKVLEIGVGGGYFAEQFSQIIGRDGVYYGIDTNEQFVNHLKGLNELSEYKNIRTIKVQHNHLPNLKIKFDLIFSRNVFHHLDNRVKYYKELNSMLDINGKVAIIDYNESISLMRLLGHYTQRLTIKHELEEAGFYLDFEADILNKQSFMVFRK